MGRELARGFALSTDWVNGDVESWTALATEGIEHDALDLVRDLSHIVGQMAETLAGIEGPDCTSEIVLKRLALDGEASSEA